jgi:hypothetical protein
MKKQGTAIRAIPLDISHPKVLSLPENKGAMCMVMTNTLKNSLK